MLSEVAFRVYTVLLAVLICLLWVCCMFSIGWEWFESNQVSANKIYSFMKLARSISYVCMNRPSVTATGKCRGLSNILVSMRWEGAHAVLLEWINSPFPAR